MTKKFNTDKYEHGYMEIYEPLFKSIINSKNVLEIGVYEGESLKLLSYYFPEAIIHGLDVQDKKHYENDKIKTYICDQENRENLKSVTDKINYSLDLIIDDGGHSMKQQQVSLGFLFSKLRKGGVYILEDLHTSKHPGLGTISKDDLITSLDMILSFQKNGKIISNHITEDEKNYLEKNIDSIYLWSKSEDYTSSVTAIIKKKN